MVEISQPLPKLASPQVARHRGLAEAWFARKLIAPSLAFIAVIVAWSLVETVRLSFTDEGMNSQH